jgi:bifunctional DNase/RNase
MPATAEPLFVDAHIVEVRRSSGDDPTRTPHVVILEETAGDRRLPIYVGAPEAMALACHLEAVERPRPMTYQLSASLVHAAGNRVAEVRITRLTEGTFYAEILIDGPSGITRVDARPSDALNLAAVCSAPIRVDNAVFEDPKRSVTGYGRPSPSAPKNSPPSYDSNTQIYKPGAPNVGPSQIANRNNTKPVLGDEGWPCPVR